MKFFQRLKRYLTDQSYVKFIESKQTIWKFTNNNSIKLIEVEGRKICYLFLREPYYIGLHYPHHFFIFEKEESYVVLKVLDNDKNTVKNIYTFKKDELHQLFEMYPYADELLINCLVDRGLLKKMETIKI